MPHPVAVCAIARSMARGAEVSTKTASEDTQQTPSRQMHLCQVPLPQL